MGGHGAPEATRGHGRPQEATRSHGRPRAAPHRPPQNIIPTKMGRPRSPERSVKKKTSDGGPRGGTGGHGGQRRGSKKVLIQQPPPFNILEDPYKLRLFGEYIHKATRWVIRSLWGEGGGRGSCVRSIAHSLSTSPVHSFAPHLAFTFTLAFTFVLSFTSTLIVT